MVGAVGLTLKRPVAAPHYDVFAQHYVDFQKVVVQIPGTTSQSLHFWRSNFGIAQYLQAFLVGNS